MLCCTAVNCTNRSEQRCILKVVPRDPEHRALWAAKVKIQNWVPTGRCYLCEVHFDADQWEAKRADSERKLKPDALPTIFHHTSLQRKKKSPMVRNILPNINLN